ncbi:hypothetical protein PIGHUM_01789 [Pigmentiphaga humi]|uniref:DUF4936 domain-containing protein n=1 Tax=Pigmentiphaga humi TaxID=2478468 RepID=A0A3P4B2E2_9BURK|nr:DUF4936 family protein [Pigmentiphaga humi]VCU69726.1 hypothetical protein PIGHUM_01789 [Pigmentiphaga humi]
MDHLYVYYKLAQADLARALAPARQVLAAGRPHARRTQLLARPGASDGVATWMEVYEGVADTAALEAALAQAAEASGLAPLLRGPRRTEAFADLPVDPADLGAAASCA